MRKIWYLHFRVEDASKDRGRQLCEVSQEHLERDGKMKLQRSLAGEVLGD